MMAALRLHHFSVNEHIFGILIAMFDVFKRVKGNQYVEHFKQLLGCTLTSAYCRTAFFAYVYFSWISLFFENPRKIAK